MNKRLILETELLLSKNDYVTVTTIATTLNYSNKTIRNDLIILEEWLKEFNLTLDKKIGVGIAILGDENIKLKVLNDISIKSNFVEEYSPEDRINYILVKLFTSNSRLRIKDLANDLHSSRATIHNDLLAASNWLKNYNIELIRKTNYGIEINASERDLRKAMSYLICSNKSFLELQAILSGEKITLTSEALKIFRFMIKADIVKLKNTVFSIKSLIDYNLTDESLLNLLVDVDIIFIRISSDKCIKLAKNSKERLVNTVEFKIAEELCRSLEASFNITFPEDEIYNLALHILCSKTNNTLYNSIETLDKGEVSEVETLAKNLILHWGKTLRLTLSEDKELLTSLVVHFKPVINGIKYGLTTSNPILDQILKYYPNTFRVVKDSIYILETHLGYKINDDEIGYITLHLASAIDRAKDTLKTMLICHGSSGESKLLKNKLSHEMNELDIVITKSSLLIENSDLKNIDLIISTVPLNINTSIDIINITPLLNKQDIIRLKALIKAIYTKKNSLSINK